MTYKELIDKLQELDDDQLNCDVTVEDVDNECYQATFDEDHPIIYIGAKPKGYVTYYHTNSDGVDWLKEKDWLALEKAGWVLRDFSSGGRYSVTKYGVKLHDAVDEWTKLTGACATDLGCPCCGPPHQFEECDADDNVIDSGPTYHGEMAW